jgi:hypothetical protein
MDMKKILQAMDGASTKPVGDSHDMKKFLSVVTEGTNRQSVAEKMITQEYSKPEQKQGNGVIKKYFESVQHELHEEAHEELTQRKQIIAEKTQRVLEKMKKADAPKPRNFVAKNATTGGAGAHKDKKKAVKQGDVKHKGKAMDVAEVSLGNYRKKAAVSKATNQIDKFFGRDDPEKVARAEKNIAKREKGLARADHRLDRTVKAMPQPVPAPIDKERLHARLAALEKEFDPHYEYSDDHRVWSHHKDIAQSIQRIKNQLRSADESMSEGDEDPCWSNYHMVGTKKKGGKSVPNCVPNKKG